MRLHWTPRSDGDAGLRVWARPTDPHFLTETAKDIGCEAVGLDARATFTPRPLPPFKSFARASAPLQLAATPSGAVLAESGTPEREVTVHGSRDGFGEISFASAGLWHGWVSTASLRPIKKLSGYGSGSGSGYGPTRHFAGLRCSRALSLYLRKDGAVLARVGTVQPDLHVALVPASNDTHRALLAEQRTSSKEYERLDLQPGYELVVEQAASQACTEELRTD